MATKTLGTNANNSIPNAIQFLPGSGSGISAADMATMRLGIKDDINVTHPVLPEAFTYDGQLFIPNRGILIVRPGDWVGVDSRGWPILLSADTIANGLWTHS